LPVSPTHLNVIQNGASQTAAVDPGLSAAKQWSWSPDAKLVKAGDNQYHARNFATGAFCVVDEAQGRVLASVAGLSVPFAIPAALQPELAERLLDLGFLLTGDQAAQYDARVRGVVARSLQRSHGLIVMPTAKCNYRCTYCYETFEQGRMKPDDADALSRAIARLGAEAPQFALGFFGGEPLMCADLVLRFSREAFGLMARRGLPYAASVSTNGHYLSPDLFDSLIDAGVVSYQISLDGDRDLHDSQRVTVAGGATFDRVLGNLRQMAATSNRFSCVVRCNVRAHDRARILALFDEPALASLKDDRRFLIDVHTIWASDRQEIAAADPGTCLSGVTRNLDLFFVNNELENRGFRTISYSHGPSLLSSACYAGKPNWFVVGPDLALYKCTVAFDRDDNKVGKIDPSGTLLVDDSKNRLWTASNLETDAGCGSCHYRVPCGGVACPLARFTEGHKACPEHKSIDRLRDWSRFRSPGQVKS
jgi:uncharacterized protein